MINNGVHDSVGGQPLVSRDVDLDAVARAMGYNTVVTVDSEESLEDALMNRDGTTFIQVMVHKGNRDDLGRPKTTPKENKMALMANIRGDLI
jgi:phosphonopyruvate decarboxylase